MTPELLAFIHASRVHCIRRGLANYPYPRTLDPALSTSLEEARRRLASDAPTPPRANPVTGLRESGPWDIAHAIHVLARDAPDDPATRDLVSRALGRLGAALAARCVPEIARVLGQDAEGSLCSALDAGAYAPAYDVMCALETLDRISPSAVARVVRAVERSAPSENAGQWFARWIRRRLALDPACMEAMRAAVRAAGSDPPFVERALQTADLELDELEIDESWERARSRLPALGVEELRVDARVPFEDGVAFLVADKVRCFVPGIEFQIFSGEHALWSLETEHLRVWRLPLADRDRSIVLVEPARTGWARALEVAGSRDHVADLVGSLTPAESWLRIPKFTRVEMRAGIVSCSIDGRYPRMIGYRIGGLPMRDLDRPFLVILWDHARATNLGVGLVRGRSFVSACD